MDPERARRLRIIARMDQLSAKMRDLRNRVLKLSEKTADKEEGTDDGR